MTTYARWVAQITTPTSQAGTVTNGLGKSLPATLDNGIVRYVNPHGKPLVANGKLSATFKLLT